VKRILTHAPFSARKWWRVPDNRTEHKMGDQVDGPGQCQRPQAGAHANQDADEAPTYEEKSPPSPMSGICFNQLRSNVRFHIKEFHAQTGNGEV